MRKGEKMFFIDKEKCVDCGYCAYVCPFDSIVHHIDEKYWEIDEKKCKQCGQCFSACIASAVFCDKDQQVVESVSIDVEACIGCTLCGRICPTGAISGQIKGKHVVIENKCIHCGACAESCRQNAIIVRKKPVYTEKGKRNV